MKQYKIDFLQFNVDQAVMSECNEITFYNTGTSSVIVNNTIKLFPGQVYTIKGNEIEIDKTVYNIVFLGGIDKNKICILRKCFI